MIPIDEYVRRLPLPTDAEAEAMDPARRAHTMDAIVSTPPGSRQLRWRRPVIVVGAAVAAVCTVGASLIWQPPRVGDISSYSNWMNCHVTSDGGPTAVVIETEYGLSGDPVVACSNEWRRVTGRLLDTAPRMRAYDDGDTTIEVLPADTEVPAGWEAIDPGPFLDPRWVELYQAVPDVIDGVASECLSTDEAVTVARSEIERIGLTGWEVRHDGPRADGSSTCAFGGVDLVRFTVDLDSRPGPEPSFGTDPTWRDLRVRLTESCGTTEEVAAMAREVLADVTPVVHEIPTARPCATAELEIGGDSPQVIVRGPSSLMP
jgi:hypothetical protein